MAEPTSLVPVERIESMILFIRGEKVMLDHDLAKLYGTTTKRLNEQVRRNARWFPPDFMFQFAEREVSALRSQSATKRHLAVAGAGERELRLAAATAAEARPTGPSYRSGLRDARTHAVHPDGALRLAGQAAAVLSLEAREPT